MRLRVRHTLERWSASPGFYPALFGVTGLALALLVGWLEFPSIDHWLGGGPWGDLLNAETGRAVFPTLAASCITVAGVVFSITVVGLLQVSAQYGPRLLGSFMRATGTRVVLGIFLGTFVYLLGVMGRIGTAALDGPQPRLAVLLGLVAAVASFGSLVFFFHHVTRFIQVSRLLDKVAGDMRRTLEREFPDARERAPTTDDPSAALPDDFAATRRTLHAKKSGYVQVFDEADALSKATSADLVLRVRVRPGDFVLQGDPLLEAAPAARVDTETRAALRRTIGIGDERTRIQDPEFAVDQMSDMAVRALSPGINDPGTAVRCIDRLTEALAHLATRCPPPPVVRSEDERVRLVARRHDQAGIVKAAFARIRQNAGDQLSVLLRLLEAIERLARRELPESMRARLVEEARAVLALAEKASPYREDRADLDARRDALAEALGTELTSD